MNRTKKYNTSISSWPKEDRPREKLLKNGEHTLNNSELLAILLRTGVKGQSAIDLARRILQKFKTFRNMSHTDIRDWKEFKGLGQAKIAQIRAALEIGRRFREVEAKEERKRIKSVKDVVSLFMPRMRDLKFEVFKVLLLDGQNKVKNMLDVEGSITRANPIIREIIHKALQNFATSIICVHNHPTGNPRPSKEDKEFTKKLIITSKIMNVELLDHIIIGNDIYYSFDEKGVLKRIKRNVKIND